MNTRLLMILPAAVLAACTPKLADQLPYYKLPVVQGMPFDEAAVRAVKPGMTRDQVKLILGAPLLRSAFHSDRWDYNYETARGGKIKSQRSFTVRFQGNVVVGVEGDALDGEKGAAQ